MHYKNEIDFIDNKIIGQSPNSTIHNSFSLTLKTKIKKEKKLHI